MFLPGFAKKHVLYILYVRTYLCARQASGTYRTSRRVLRVRDILARRTNAYLRTFQYPQWVVIRRYVDPHSKHKNTCLAIRYGTGTVLYYGTVPVVASAG